MNTSNKKKIRDEKLVEQRSGMNEIRYYWSITLDDFFFARSIAVVESWIRVILRMHRRRNAFISGMNRFLFLYQRKTMEKLINETQKQRVLL